MGNQFTWKRKYIQMIRVHVDQERNIKNVVESNLLCANKDNEVAMFVKFILRWSNILLRRFFNSFFIPNIRIFGLFI